jgi:hypothetical protein
VDQLQALRARCQRQTNSFVTPMGDEMYYHYQQALIDEAATTLAALLQRVRHPTREQAGCCRCPATYPHRHRLDQTLPLIATAALRVKSCGEAVRCDENVRRYLLRLLRAAPRSEPSRTGT